MVAVAGVTISGNAIDVVNNNITLTAMVSPANATLPVTYTWSTDGLQSGQDTTTAVYQWDDTDAGDAQTVTVNADNGEGDADDSHTVTVYDWRARGEIHRVIDAVSNTGNVYAYARWFVLRKDFVTLMQATIDSDEVIRTFEISGPGALTPEQAEFYGDSVGAFQPLVWTIRGYFGHNDSNKSQIEAGAVTRAVILALNSDSTLHRGQIFYDSSLAVLTAFEPVLLGNTLVHRATIAVTVTEFMT